MKMDKKKIIYFVLVVFIVVVFISIMMSNNKSEEVKDVSSDYDSSYYVEANHNIFVKLANICDDCCYYLVDMMLGGIETIFSSFLGN